MTMREAFFFNFAQKNSSSFGSKLWETKTEERPKINMGLKFVIRRTQEAAAAGGVEGGGSEATTTTTTTTNAVTTTPMEDDFNNNNKEPTRFSFSSQRRDGNEGEEKGEGTTERSEEEEKGGEEEEEGEKKFTDEGVPIAHPDDYVGTSTTIVTPDGITMHRTSRGAFKCGQCKYCVQPSLKQKCIYNNATKKERDTSGRAKSGLATTYTVPPAYANSKTAIAGAAFFNSDKQKNNLYAPRKFAAKGREEDDSTAGEGFSRQRPMGAQSKYIGIIKTSTAKVVIAKNFDISKEAIAKTVTRWTKEKMRVPNVYYEEEEETEKFGTDINMWKRQKGESCERPTWTPLPEMPPETSEKEEMNEDDKALLQPILPGMDDGQRVTAAKRSNFQSNVASSVASPTAEGSDVKPLLAVPVPSQGGRIYNDKVDPSLLVVACSEPGCRERFLDRPRMLRHVASAHREKRFVCDWEGCGKAFVDNSKLQRHRVTHTQEKNCFCDVCGASFGLKFNLNTHLKNVHGITPDTRVYNSSK